MNPRPTPLQRTLRRFGLALLATAAVALAPARAEDIDLFSIAPGSTDLPNVLFIIDNSGNSNAQIDVPCNNWPDTGTPLNAQDQSKKFGTQLCAMVWVVDRLIQRAQAQGVNAVAHVGVMLFNSDTDKTGAYPRISFMEASSANRATLVSKIKGITSQSNQDSAAASPSVGLGLYEAYLWFKGMPVLHGKKTPSYDSAAFSGNNYISPSANSCGRNYIIFISNGTPATQSQTVADEQTRLAAISTDTSSIAAPSGLNNATTKLFDSRGDELARALLNADFSAKDGVQSIQTFAVTVINKNETPANYLTSPFSSYYAFFNSVGRYGGSTPVSNTSDRYFYATKSAAEIALAIDEVFDRILSSTNVFASAALPISVNTQGIYKNQIFIGMFRPDPNMLPRWYGNLKQYKFAFDANTRVLSMVDAAAKAALNTDSGYLLDTSVSFWTTDSSFWSNSPRGSKQQTSDSPDGNTTELGGAAQRQREAYATSQAGRNVFTCISCVDAPASAINLTSSSNSFTSSISTAILPNGALGAANKSGRDDIIDWTRGTNNVSSGTGVEEAARPTTTPATTVRPSIQGDVLHSRPAVVDYGGLTGTVVFYGSNDGMLRAIDGNQTGANAGRELWAFVPEEMLGKLKRLRDNSPEIKYPTNSNPSATKRDYFVDGPMTVFRNQTPGSEQVILYVTLRRGGRAMYAIDVTTPSEPKYLWRFDTSQFARLGQTWSEPRLARIRGNTNPVIVMGAGYDSAAEDVSPPGTVTMGDAVLVIDAKTGALVGSLTMAGMRAVPGAVAMIDSDSDGYVDRAYFGDTGARLYRIDFENAAGSSAVADWAITLMGSFAVNNAERKFLYEPDVVVTKNLVAVMAGSGDRENPLVGRIPYTGTTIKNTQDSFFTLYDTYLGKGAPRVRNAVTNQWETPAALTVSNLGRISYDGSNWSGNANTQGCYIELPYSNAGEKVVNPPITVGGRTLFSTNTPTPATDGQCSSLGTARAYAVPAFCGMPRSVELKNGGLPPTPVTGLVDVGNGVIQRFLIGGAPGDGQGYEGSTSSIGVSRLGVSTDKTRRRTYWYPNRSR